MRLLRIIAGLLLAAGFSARAVSLFPGLINVPVAMTTNRETARGIASDGTNFLAVLQGDNLYAAAVFSNQLAAQLICPAGTLIGSRIDLLLNGSVPIVAFGSSNYLVVWTDLEVAPRAVQGQLLDRAGQQVGGSFVIASNTAAVEAGAILFSAGQFWIARAQTNVANDARIVVQRLSEGGDQVGAALLAGDVFSADQRFPVLSASATNVLLAWVAQRADTNLWDVLGRSIGTNGEMSAPFAISQTPALMPGSIGAASDNTNHLVVWSRQTELARRFYVGELAPPIGFIYTNRFNPSLFGRIISGSNTTEFSISHSGWGQESSTVAFDGRKYLVAWNDLRFSQYGYNSDGGGFWDSHSYSTNYAVHSCFVTPEGVLAGTEFVVSKGPDYYSGYDWMRNYSSEYHHGGNSRPALTVNQAGEIALVRTLSDRHPREPDDVKVIVTAPPDHSPIQMSIHSPTSGTVRITFTGPVQVGLTLVAATNVGSWSNATSVLPWGKHLTPIRMCAFSMLLPFPGSSSFA